MEEVSGGIRPERPNYSLLFDAVHSTPSLRERGGRLLKLSYPVWGGERGQPDSDLVPGPQPLRGAPHYVPK